MTRILARHPFATEITEAIRKKVATDVETARQLAVMNAVYERRKVQVEHDGRAPCARPCALVREHDGGGSSRRRGFPVRPGAAFNGGGNGSTCTSGLLVYLVDWTG